MAFALLAWSSRVSISSTKCFVRSPNLNPMWSLTIYSRMLSARKVVASPVLSISLNCMLDRGCDPDLVTCDILLRALREKLDPPQDGREFLDQLVVRLLKRERIAGASTIIEVMLRKFLSPKTSTWTRVIQKLCKPGKVKRAIEMCQSRVYC